MTNLKPSSSCSAMASRMASSSASGQLGPADLAAREPCAFAQQCRRPQQAADMFGAKRRHRDRVPRFVIERAGLTRTSAACRCRADCCRIHVFHSLTYCSLTVRHRAQMSIRGQRGTGAGGRPFLPPEIPLVYEPATGGRANGLAIGHGPAPLSGCVHGPDPLPACGPAPVLPRRRGMRKTRPFFMRA